MTPPYKATAIANLFLRRAMLERKQITSLKLQKLIYLAHGYYMSHLLLDCIEAVHPLIKEPFQTWQFGPACPAIYDEFRYFGRGPVFRLAMEHRPEAQAEMPVETPENDSVLDSVQEYVWVTYGNQSAAELCISTCQPNKAWHRVLQNSGQYPLPAKEIPNALILRDFRGLVHRRD